MPGSYPRPERAESKKKKNVVLVRHFIFRVPSAESTVPPPTVRTHSPILCRLRHLLFQFRFDFVTLCVFVCLFVCLFVFHCVDPSLSVCLSVSVFLRASCAILDPPQPDIK